MSNPVKFVKTISGLPEVLEISTFYAVRVGTGYDLHLSDATGTVAYKINQQTVDLSNYAIKDVDNLSFTSPELAINARTLSGPYFRYDENTTNKFGTTTGVIHQFTNTGRDYARKVGNWIWQLIFTTDNRIAFNQNIDNVQGSTHEIYHSGIISGRHIKASSFETNNVGNFRKRWKKIVTTCPGSGSGMMIDLGREVPLNKIISLNARVDGRQEMKFFHGINFEVTDTMVMVTNNIGHSASNNQPMTIYVEYEV